MRNSMKVSYLRVIYCIVCEICTFFYLFAQHPEDRISSDMKRRAEVLFDKILRYSYKVLTWSNNSQLPGLLTDQETKRDLFYTMLFNDEIHTYDQVTPSVT